MRWNVPPQDDHARSQTPLIQVQRPIEKHAGELSGRRQRQNRLHPGAWSL